RLLEASTMKSRRGFAIQRLMNAMRQAHADGWFIVFDTLTLADDRLEAFYDNPNALRDYFRDIGRMVLAAEGRKANDSHADCYQYFCVPDYGTPMAVFISMRCTLCGHFLQVALTLILVVGYAIAASLIACKIRGLMVTVCPSQFATRRTLFHVLVGCGLLMLKVSRLKLPVIWLLVSMWLNTLTKSQIWTLLLKV